MLNVGHLSLIPEVMLSAKPSRWEKCPPAQGVETEKSEGGSGLHAQRKDGCGERGKHNKQMKEGPISG